MQPSRPLATLLSLVLCCACRSTPLERHEFSERKMGTEFRLVLFSESAEQAHAAALLAWSRIDEIEACMSDYREGSELRLLPERSRTDAGAAWVPVSTGLWRVLSEAQRFSRSSGGAFDVSVGPYVKLWRRTRRQERAPSIEALQRASESVGHEKLELDAATQSVRLLAGSMQLDLGGIAKGFALDEALEILEASGIRSALIDGGGDVRVGAAPPDRDGWRIRLETPGADITLSLVDASVATSGDAYRFVELEGVRYSHIIDPRSGSALVRQATVSIVAADAMTADAAASTAAVLGPEAGAAWVARQPELRARFAWLEKGQLRTCGAGDFERMMVSEPAQEARPPATQESP